MASTATSRNRFEKQGTGENVNSWGVRLNQNGLDLIDSALDGVVSFTLSGNKTLTSSNFSADEARMRVINVTGGTGGTITVPSVEKYYLVRNAAAGPVYITTGGGAQAMIAPGSINIALSDNTNYYTIDPIDYAAAASANYSATSASSVTIGSGVKSFTIESGKVFLPGQFVVAAEAASPTVNWLWGQVISYDDQSGDFSLDVYETSGIGTYSDWFIGLSGPQGDNGDLTPPLTGNAGKVLSVNPGETDFLWIDQGWELIGTLSPSASEAIFSSIPTIYSDLLIGIENATWSSFPALSVSPNGSSWASNMTSWGPSAPGSGCYGAVEITGIRHNVGLWRAYAETGASPAMSGTIQSGRWRVTGGITAVRISGSTGANFTGTCHLFGRL